MKHIIEFDLPEDQEEMMLAINASKYSIVLYNLDQYLRSKVKYAPDSQPEAITETYDSVRTKLFELLNEYDLTI
jgi:hypothetical protein